MPIEEYAILLDNASCIVGNSSSAIRDGSFIGTPAVNIGTRQNSGLHGPNVINVDYDVDKIYLAIKKQIKKRSINPQKFMEMVILQKK